MDDCIILSSDSEEEREQQIQAIQGIPQNFNTDNKEKFSFDVTLLEQSIISSPTQPSNIADYDDSFDLRRTPPPKSVQRTPRRRSMSVTCLSAKKNDIEEPPTSKICSGLVQMPPIDSDSDDQEEETNEQRIDEQRELLALLSPAKAQRGRKKKCEEVLNEFYGVYCLISRSERPCYKNRCYIGYTVDPNRRIMQHNGGRGKGGAKKTDSRGPWEMVCVIHGFPNSVAALRFEWAWQNPNTSKILKSKGLKKERKETPFAYQLRIACHLMNSRPFNQFALSFRWLLMTAELPFPFPPPDHVKKRYGKVKKEMSIVPAERNQYEEMGECRLCGKEIDKIWHLVRCTSPSESCKSHFHTKCLAEHALRGISNLVIPLKGNCPTCGFAYLWGDVIREQRRILKVSTKANEELKTMVVKKGLPYRSITPPLTSN